MISQTTEVWTLLFFLAITSLPHALSSYDFFSPKYPFRHLSSSLTDLITFNSSQSSYYRALRIDETNGFLYIGGKNHVFRVPLNNITDTDPKRTLNIPAEASDYTFCRKNLGKLEDECQNYIKIILHDEDSPENLLLCGTNAWEPRCYEYIIGDIAPPPINNSQIDYSNDLIFISVGNPTDGTFKCPFGKDDNSNALLADGVLYTATHGDRAGTDVLIFREEDGENGFSSLRTKQYSDPWFYGEATLIQMFEIGDEVYVFFREIAYEAINYEKVFFSRVARVCKNDQGGVRHFNNEDEWTTYLKTRLNCSVPGEFPVYFNEIQDAFMVQDNSTTLIYAIFTTPSNSNPMSAVCVYNIDTIKEIFEKGAFKGQADRNSLWLPIKNKLVPRPGDCGDPEAMKEADDTLLFIEDNPLMDEAASPIHGSPVLSTSRDRFVKIVVERTGSIDVLYIATDRGTVLKAVYYSQQTPEGFNSYVIQETVITQNSILSMKIPKNNPKYIYVGTKDSVVQLPIAQCNYYKACGECLSAMDPHCKWEPSDSGSGKCIERQEPVEIDTLIQMDPSSCLEWSNKTITLGKPIGQPVVLPCSLNDAEWYRDGNPLDISYSSKYTLINGVGMLMDSVEASDSGSYTCQSRGSLATHVKLTVQNPEAYTLQFTEPYVQDQSATACAGATLYLYCRALGAQNLKFHWTRNDQDLIDGTYVYNEATLARVDGCDYDQVSWLKITMTENSVGEYVCRVDSDNSKNILLSGPADISMGEKCITTTTLENQAIQWEFEKAKWDSKMNAFNDDVVKSCSSDVKECKDCLNLKPSLPTN